MTLQQPSPEFRRTRPTILCRKCENPITFEDHVAPSGRKIPLEPNTDGDHHIKYCIYASMKDNPHTEALFIDFLSLVPNKRPRRIIGAVGRAK